MGCYLAKPITDKEVEDIADKGLRVGACSMQGWRNGQEDAHSIELCLTPDISLFAVFDGHGGAEVAEWSAKTLPAFIRDSLTKNNIVQMNNFTEKLEEIFIQHDEKILSESVIAELHTLAGRDAPATERDEMRGELDDLNAEAEMTHDELLAKYGLNKEEYAEQKNEIADMFMKQWGDLKEAENDDSSDDDEEEVVKPKNGLNSLAEPSSTVSSEPATDDSYQPGIDITRSLPAEERAAGLSSANDENGCGGVVLEDHSEASSDHSTEEEEGEESKEYKRVNNPLLRSDDVEVCGYDSGTTCILALYQRATEELLIGNIGDSRAVLCRAGLAIDMSLDHKPEDDIELDRIKKAGGYLTGDGRVKGGLNLSRAFGDHIYKDNSKIPLKDQMITAFPDVTHFKVTKDDEFMILACDGIWNVMSSQECVDFVRDRLEKDSCISDILCELFDQCLAPDTQGDGTGCDNMTCIVVQIKPRIEGVSKRPRSEDDELTGAGDAKMTRIQP